MNTENTQKTETATGNAIEDRKVIFVDAGKNTKKVKVNSYGKLMKFDNGGFRIGIVDGCDGEKKTFYNTKASNSFAAEAFAILKGIEFAKENTARGRRSKSAATAQTPLAKAATGRHRPILGSLRKWLMRTTSTFLFSKSQGKKTKLTLSLHATDRQT